ncbi:MAG: hypothetical protein R2746_08895 [Acidimicrobiales bacterium]
MAGDVHQVGGEAHHVVGHRAGAVLVDGHDLGEADGADPVEAPQAIGVGALDRDVDRAEGPSGEGDDLAGGAVVGGLVGARGLVEVVGAGTAVEGDADGEMVGCAPRPRPGAA